MIHVLLLKFNGEKGVILKTIRFLLIFACLYHIDGN